MLLVSRLLFRFTSITCAWVPCLEMIAFVRVTVWFVLGTVDVYQLTKSQVGTNYYVVPEPRNLRIRGLLVYHTQGTAPTAPLASESLGSLRWYVQKQETKTVVPCCDLQVVVSPPASPSAGFTLH